MAKTSMEEIIKLKCSQCGYIRYGTKKVIGRICGECPPRGVFKEVKRNVK